MTYSFSYLELVCCTVNIWYSFFHLFNKHLLISDISLLFNLKVISNSATPWTVACQSPLSKWIFQARILESVAISHSREIFLTQGSNPCLLQWQVASLPLSHMGSPHMALLLEFWKETGWLEPKVPNLVSQNIPIHTRKTKENLNSVIWVLGKCNKRNGNHFSIATMSSWSDQELYRHKLQPHEYMCT